MMDEAMVNAVYDVVRDSFLKSKGVRNVEILAAERLAVDLLNDAWKELEKFKVTDGDKSPPLRQVGL